MKNDLVVKEVNFNGDVLVAVKNNSTGKIFTGVKWVCDGLGLDTRRQREKLQEHLTLKKGVSTLPLPSNGGIQNTLAIELDFLPLWLATINPALVKEEIKTKLVEYQLKAKDVLAQAFIKPKTLSPIEELKLHYQVIEQHEEKLNTIESKISKLENNMTIDYAQQENLSTRAKAKIVQVLGGKDAPAYRKLNKKAFSLFWRDYKRYMQVASYKDTPVKEIDRAFEFISKWEPTEDLHLMIIGANSQMRIAEKIC